VANTGNAVIDAPTFQAAIGQFQDLLAQNEQLLNDLNVYPVPDSDTGSNTLHTLKAGIANAPGQMAGLGDYATALAMGAAKAAMGNSGVILAQYLQGLSQGLSQIETLDHCSPSEWQQALQQAAVVARESVLTPAEGTMLTIADAAANVAAQTDFQEYYQAIQIAVRAAVIETQNLLPELVAAEVVDSGALALSFFHDSVALNFGIEISPLQVQPRKLVESIYAGPEFELMFSVTCIESIKSEIETAISDLGESISISGIEPDFNFHIHTDNPDLVIQCCEVNVEVTNIRISELGK
jgi:dihydroxyacetone kinase-like predicted kinase